MSLVTAEKPDAAVSADGATDETKLQAALAAGMAALNLGDAAGALAHLAPVEDLAFARDRASYVFGLFYFSIGETESALRWFDRALALRPSLTEALSARAIALQKLGRSGDALESLAALLRLEPTNCEALYLTGALHQSLGHAPQALEFYTAALAQKPDYCEAHLNRGALLEQLGRLDEALAAFDAVLAIRPHDALANFNRGSVLQSRGEFEKALAAYERAAAENPADPEVELNRGNVLQKLGRFETALARYDRALRLRPNYPQAHYNRGIALHRLERLTEAVVAFDAALAQKPSYPEACCNRGNVLIELKRYDEALAAYDAALRLQPGFPQARINRLNVLFAQERYAAVLEAAAEILAQEPDHAQAFCVKGAALHRLSRLDEALEALDHALRVRPTFPEAWLNRGNVLQEMGRLGESLASYDNALKQREDYPEVLSGRGVALKELGRLDESLASIEAALALKPDYPDARNNRAGVLLLKGEMKRGLADFESRWERSNAPRKTLHSSLPTWQGEPLEGRHLLVWDEQGLGDLIQFARYLPILTAHAGQVTLLGRRNMHRLLATLPDPPRFVESVTDESPYDYQIALMSLPHVLGTELETVPAPVPYLYPEPDRVARWAERIGRDGFRIGICWHGNRKINLERSIPLAEFAPLAALDDVRLISLMKDGAEAASSDVPVEMLGSDFDAGPDAFLDTAAVMANLDLIVTSDTSIVHLAGALGRPTYLALKKVPDWRWLSTGEWSPWYPTLRLFRQAERGDWRPVMERIAAVISERRRFPEAAE